jgi:hypothetical protein
MAKQSSYIKLEGTIGDLSFYKNRDSNYIARRKGGVTKDRLLNDPRFERTRENMKEFSRAASAAKFLKNAFREIEIKSNGGTVRTDSDQITSATRKFYVQKQKELAQSLVSF